MEIINREEIMRVLAYYFGDGKKAIRAYQNLKSGLHVKSEKGGLSMCFDGDNALYVSENEILSYVRTWNTLGTYFEDANLIRGWITEDVAAIPGVFLDSDDISTLLLKINPKIVVIMTANSAGHTSILNCFVEIESQMEVLKWIRKELKARK